MHKFPDFLIPKFSYICGISIALTIILWLLRGFQILESVSGGVILGLVLLSIASAVISLLQRKR